MKYEAYLITCLTNMHAGSGDATFGVAENLVQRDPVTNHPTIHGPSLKGALREHFRGSGKNGAAITDIFGSKNDDKKQKQGNYRFFSAHLLSIPVRSDQKPFYVATTPSLVQAFTGSVTQFGIQMAHTAFDELAKLKPKKGKPLVGDEFSPTNPPGIEDCTGVHSATMKGLDTILGPDLAVFHEDDLKEITADLPMIARNQLENGESKNLWYEEIVPHQTRFFFIVGKGENYGDVFDNTLKESVVQIGANASIGYGYTRIRKLNNIGGLDE